MSEATQRGAEDVVDILAARFDSKPEEIPEEEKSEEEAKVEEEAEEKEEEKGAEETPEEDTPEEVTLEASELAGYLGIEEDAIDTDDDGNLLLKTKIDGEEGKASLAELIKSYQLEGHVNKRSMELAEKRKSFDAEVEQAKSQLQQQFKQTESLIEYAKGQVLEEFNSINWEQLSQDDPGVYAMQRQKLNERYQQLEQAQNANQQQAQQVTSDQQKEMLNREGQLLMDAMPEWVDSEKRELERKDLSQYLLKSGYSEQEVNSVYDHRSVILARKAMLYDALQSKTDQKVSVAKKKIKKIPKIVKSGSTKTKSQKKSAANEEQLKRFKRSGGKIDDLAALLVDRM